MPNWCSNRLTLTHKDSTLIDRAERAAGGETLLSEFFPCPKELSETIAGSFADSKEQADLKEREAANLRKFGYANWYDWRVEEWGTKWDVECHDVQRISPTQLLLRFDSAWSPPTAWYKKMQTLGFKVEASYYEGGCNFAGSWEDGEDFTVSGWSNSTEAGEMIPREIDEEFGISEMLAMEEEDNRAEG